MNTAASLDDSLHLTDAIPSGSNYVPGSLHASSGDIFDYQAPVLEWFGSMSNQNYVNIWYDTRVTRVTAGAITNSAIFDVGSRGHYLLDYTLIVNGMNRYFPVIMR